MAMTQEQFDALVRRLEGYAGRHPGAYRLRVGLLAALGYAYIFAVLALLLVAIALLAWSLAYLHFSSGIIKIGWLLFTLMAVILRALWVRFPAPQGVELRREEVPRLFTLIDGLRSALRAPRFHHVLLTDDFNAGVVQVPRLGLFGWQRNYLLLGLPILQALAPEQFRAVLAHEFAHLSGNHSRFAGWIYRVRRTWFQLLERLRQERHPGSVVFEPFYHWFVSFFSAYSFVLARADEFVADRCAAELAGARSAAEALVNVELKARYLQTDFWPGVYKAADQQPEPPAAAFTAMLRTLPNALAPETASQWLDQALAQQTSNQDTHPSLSDRLSALGFRSSAPGDPSSSPERPPLPSPVEETAAQSLLGTALQSLTERLELAWKEEVAPRWRERYAQVQAAQRQLSAIEEKAGRGPLTAEETWDRARLTGELQGNEAAIPLLQALLAAQPDHAQAHYALGQILLEQKDAAGILHIERAMEKDPNAILPGCQSVYGFLKQQGRAEEAEGYRQRAEQHHQLLARAQQERASVNARDRLEPHALPAEAVKRLREQLSRFPLVGTASLVRKAVTCFPEQPFYVLGVFPHHPWYSLHSEKSDHELARRLAAELQFPGYTRIIVVNRHTRKLGKVLRKVADSEIYRR
jgi:Zn-dependent protease with chaperone function